MSPPGLQIKSHQTQEGNSHIGRRQAQEDDTKCPESSICVVSYSKCPSQNTHVENSTECLLNFWTQPQDFQLGICRSSRSAQHKMERKKKSLSCLKTKRQPAKPCGNQTPSGPHCCKACGKTSHYKYTLKAHARAHTADNVHVCGICGKHLGTSVKLISHLQSKKKRSKCGSHSKQFSNNGNQHKTRH